MSTNNETWRVEWDSAEHGGWTVYRMDAGTVIRDSNHKRYEEAYRRAFELNHDAGQPTPPDGEPYRPTAAHRIREAREARGDADPLNRLQARNAGAIAAGAEPIVEQREHSGSRRLEVLERDAPELVAGSAAADRRRQLYASLHERLAGTPGALELAELQELEQRG